MPDREQRRLTTILAADVAGYSRLMGADEEATMRRLRALRAELFDPTIAAAHHLLGRHRRREKRADKMQGRSEAELSVHAVYRANPWQKHGIRAQVEPA